MKRLLLTALASIAVLSGCATGVSGERVVGMPESPLWHKTASMETKVAYFKPRCIGYGYQPGTPEMTRCIQSEFRDSRRSRDFARMQMAILMSK